MDYGEKIVKGWLMVRRITLKIKKSREWTDLKNKFYFLIQWNEQNKVLEAVVSLAHFDHENTQTAGVKIFALNAKTMERMLLDYAKLYSVKWEMEVLIPDRRAGYISVFDKGVRIVWAVLGAAATIKSMSRLKKKQVSV